MSEFVGDVAATAVKVAGKGLFKTALGAVSGLWWLPWAIAGGSMVVGVGGTLWYRSQYHACVAAGAEALVQQRDIDRRDNAAAVSSLTRQLNSNERAYDKALSVLSGIPRNNACERDTGVRAVIDQLCAKYPASPSCIRRDGAPKVP